MKMNVFLSAVAVVAMAWLGGVTTASAQKKEAYAVLSEDGLKVTFYYDTEKSARGGMNLTNSYRNNSPYGTAKTAVIDASFADYRPTETSFWFYDCSELDSIAGMGNLNTEEVTRMYAMFERCESLPRIDLSKFNTANVTTMQEMFAGCKSLTSLDVSSLNTSNVTNMLQMFFRCSGLTTLDLSGFDTSNVTAMDEMFYECTSLASLDVSRFNTEKVTSMYRMFTYCSSLTSLDVSGFNTANVTNMKAMFYDCRSLKSLDVSGFSTASAKSMEAMFWRCSALTSLDVSKFDTSNATDMYGMFSYCSGLTSLDLSGFNTEKVEDMSRMFNGCSGLTTIFADETKWSTAAVTKSVSMFSGCTSLVGGNGTKYNAAHQDAEYARVDKDGQLGYLTDRNVSGIRSVSTAGTMDNGRWYTLDGRRVEGGEPASRQGVYVRDGRKVVRR